MNTIIVNKLVKLSLVDSVLMSRLIKSNIIIDDCRVKVCDEEVTITMVNRHVYVSESTIFDGLGYCTYGYVNDAQACIIRRLENGKLTRLILKDYDDQFSSYDLIMMSPIHYSGTIIECDEIGKIDIVNVESCIVKVIHHEGHCAITFDGCEATCDTTHNTLTESLLISESDDNDDPMVLKIRDVLRKTINIICHDA